MKYEIVEADSADSLANLVQDRLDQGWWPSGGVAIIAMQRSPTNHYIYYQSMFLIDDINSAPRLDGVLETNQDRKLAMKTLRELTEGKLPGGVFTDPAVRLEAARLLLEESYYELPRDLSDDDDDDNDDLNPHTN